VRGLLLVPLLCAVLIAGGGEAERRFRDAYRKDASPEERRTAILDLARSDTPEAAAVLVGLWADLEREAGRQSQDLKEVRDKIRELSRQLLDPKLTEARKRDAIKDKIGALGEIDVVKNELLAATELEQAAVLDGLRAMKAPETMDWIARTGLDRARDPVLLHALAVRIAASRATGVAPLLAALGKVRKPEQLVPLLQALGEHGEALGDALDVLVRHLGHREWVVRVAAAYALAAAARAEGVGPLVDALVRERDRSRAQREIARALARLTGQNFGIDLELWKRWWKANRDRVLAGEIELGKGNPDGSGKADGRDQGFFYGIPQRELRIIYVFDASGSMEVSMKNPRWIGDQPVPARDDEERRFDAAMREMLRATKTLAKGSSYAVILFSDHVDALHDALVAATPEEHARLTNALARAGPSGSTNVYEALEYALRLANVQPGAKGEPKADAIYLLSDGSPTDAKGKVEAIERTLQAVRGWNALGKVAIHTVGIGAQHNAEFLRALAEQNGGEYHAVGDAPRKKR